MHMHDICFSIDCNLIRLLLNYHSVIIYKVRELLTVYDDTAATWYHNILILNQFKFHIII